MAARKKGLNPRQTRFVEEFLIDLNATQAYIRAGYAKRGAEQNAAILMANHKVKAAIAEGKAARSERTETTADWVLKTYREVWDADILDILDERWQVKPLKDWPPIWRKMTTPADVKDLMARSSDGKADAWDAIGKQIKLNCFPKATALQKIGEHVAVKAFPQKSNETNIHLHLDESVQRLVEARERENKRLQERVH